MRLDESDGEEAEVTVGIESEAGRQERQEDRRGDGVGENERGTEMRFDGDCVALEPIEHAGCCLVRIV